MDPVDPALWQKLDEALDEFDAAQLEIGVVWSAMQMAGKAPAEPDADRVVKRCKEAVRGVVDASRAVLLAHDDDGEE